MNIFLLTQNTFTVLFALRADVDLQTPGQMNRNGHRVEGHSKTRLSTLAVKLGIKLYK